MKQQKGRRIPIQLLELVTKEIKRLLQEGHIVKVGQINDDGFLQPTVITIKEDKRENCTGCTRTKSRKRHEA